MDRGFHFRLECGDVPRADARDSSGAVMATLTLCTGGDVSQLVLKVRVAAAAAGIKLALDEGPTAVVRARAAGVAWRRGPFDATRSAAHRCLRCAHRRAR